jgi:hypothetical protein
VCGGGCWCIGFHPDGFQGSAVGNRDAKRAHVDNGTVHQILVYLNGECVGWCQYGSTAEVAIIKNAKAYGKHRRHGVARAALAAVLSAIAEAGGGVVEAYPEQLARRGPQRGAYLHTGPESLFEEFGFVRDRRIAKWRWVMRLIIAPEPDG